MNLTIPVRDPGKAYIDTWLWLPKKHISIEVVQKSLIIPVQKRGDTEFLYMWRDSKYHLGVPRERLDTRSLPYPVVDLRPKNYEYVPFNHRITLDFKRPEKTAQKDAYKDWLKTPCGILNLSCGLGKTVLGLRLISDSKKPAMVINDQNHILDQWLARTEEFLDVPGGVGWVQGKPETWDWDKNLVFASMKTLAMYADRVPAEMSRKYGIILWDEIHHLAALEFSKTADLFFGHRYGLTATAQRDDGAESLYYWHVGDIFHSNLEQDVIPEVTFIKSPTTIDLNDEETWFSVTDVRGEIHIAKLAAFVGQLDQEVAFAKTIVDEGIRREKKMLCITLSKEHTWALTENYLEAGILNGDIKRKSRLVMLERDLVFATVNMAKEALDKEELDSLVILTEFSSQNMLQQSMGRIQRFLDNKGSTRVIVIWHVNIPPLAAMGKKLMRHFSEWGMKVTVK